MKRKTFVIPDGTKEREAAQPAFSFGGDGHDARDTSKPVAFDEHGQPIYAPRGVIVRGAK